MTWVRSAKPKYMYRIFKKHVSFMNFSGHTDTVNSVGFSHDGTMVATADMKGLIKVWHVDKCSEIWSFEADEVEVRPSTCSNYELWIFDEMIMKHMKFIFHSSNCLFCTHEVP